MPEKTQIERGHVRVINGYVSKNQRKFNGNEAAERGAYENG